MSKLLILYNYNKYYNRIIKRLETFNDYLALITPQGNNEAAYRGFVRENMNFDYQDGVNARHIINIKKDDPQYAKIEHPDYCVLEETYVQGEGDSAITTKKLSRYFILDVTKVRGNQFQLSLRRDLLADYYNNVINAPVFIQRGTPNINDPIIFNKEGFTYNQIKKGELLLNDNKFSGKQGGWVVGYLARGSFQSDTNIQAQVKIPVNVPNYSDLPTKIKAQIDASSVDRGFHIYDPESYRIIFGCRVQTSISQTYEDRTCVIDVENDYDGELTVSCTTRSSSPYSYLSSQVDFITRNNAVWTESAILEKLESSFRSSSNTIHWLDTISNYLPDIAEGTEYQYVTYSEIRDYRDFFYKKDNKYYHFEVINPTDHNAGFETYTKSEISAGSDSLAVALRSYFANSLVDGAKIVNNTTVGVNIMTTEVMLPAEICSVRITEVDFDLVEGVIPKDRNTLNDAPYDMFCIPLGNVPVMSSGVEQFITASNIAVPLARAIAESGTKVVYDVQVLPYCPFDEMLDNQGNITITGFTVNDDYTLVTKTVAGNTVNTGIILFPKKSRGTFDINIDSSSEFYNELALETIQTVEKKVKTETKFIRLVSPNFASMSEFDPQKNNGMLSFNVDYFLKPYSPYIHVAPYFDGLYGRDFNDPKGLICSGDFSITTVSDLWEEYQIQNKNYELIFNRQIQNLDINNSIAYEQAEITAYLNAGSTALQGAASGIVAGGLIGGAAGSSAGPYGTVIGAAVGGVAGAGAGIGGSIWAMKKDLELLAESQKEAKSFAKDMYTYHLGNIKALPNALTRVTSLTENNKIFPFIEFYDSTDEEKEALRNKLSYNGFTIMRIGKIIDYIQGNQNYVQGQLIRFTGIEEDSHVVAEIAKEIEQGAYYYGNDSE